MSEEASKQESLYKFEPVRMALYEGGTVKYAVEGQPSGLHKTVLFVPGYNEGHIALSRIAREMASDREVIIPEQPGKRVMSGNSSLTNQAEAILAIIRAEDLTERPVDVVAHSFGALVLEQAAATARELGWDTFDYDEGSRSILFAPAGSNPDESIPAITPRFLKMLGQISSADKKIDKKIANNGAKEFASKPIQHTREVWPITHQTIEYDNLYQKTGLKPMVFQFPNDPLYKHEVIGNTFMTDDGQGIIENIAAYASPVGPGGPSLELASEYGLDTPGQAYDGIYSHTNANHNDLLYNSARSARAAKQYFDEDISHLQKRHKDWLVSQSD